MITITISPKDAQQMGVLAEVLKGLMEGLQPPATPPTREEMDAAIKTAEQIHHKAEAPKAVKPPKPTAAAPAAAPAAATPTPQAASPETSAAQPTQAVAVPPAAESPSEEAAPAPTIGTIAYDTIAKHITEVVKSDRAKVVAALAKFGVKKGTELKPSQYAAFLEALA